MENLKTHTKTLSRSLSEDKIYRLDIKKKEPTEIQSQKKRRTFKKIRRRLFASRRRTKNHMRKNKIKFGRASIPDSSVLFFLSLMIFSFMCYLLGIDPSLIPFTLVFTLVVTMFFLEEKQRDLLIEKIFPSSAINFFRWVWAFVSSSSDKKNNPNINNNYNNIEDISHEDPYQKIHIQHQIINDELEHPLLCI